MLKFFSAQNLSSDEVAETYPWDFDPGAEAVTKIKALKKSFRRSFLTQPTTSWCCYSPFRGLNRGRRLAKDNPPVGARGLSADFDAVTPQTAISAALAALPEDFMPQYVETSIGGKVRLVWVFERELLMPSSEFAAEFIRTFFRKVGVPTLLAGYDANSEKPAELWSNGVEWVEYKTTPVPFSVCFGVVCEVAKKSSLFGREEVPLPLIAEEIGKRFPNKWVGEFKEGAIGTRFWDPSADNPTGCQVKPDGMLCFTGHTPFMKWADILGREWVESQRVLQLGKAADNIYFDGRNYFRQLAERWKVTNRQDVLLALKNRGLSDKAPKGVVISDAERVLAYIQDVNQLDGAAPLINYAPGVVQVREDRILNTLRLYPVLPSKEAKGDPDEFPFIDSFLSGLLARPENGATDHLLSWMKRYYGALLNHERLMGQTLFLAGPAQSGKTLLCLRILTPLFGGKSANPHAFMTGDTSFNDEMFEAALWCLNDEESPRNEAARQSFAAKLKSFVVNPSHVYHPKFQKKLTIEWVGRTFITLNDDPQSVGILPEVNDNTADKMSFFASKPFTNGNFPSGVEKIIEKELPYFAHWLLNVYQPPEHVLSGDRCGVKSYYDPVILSLSQRQQFAHNLTELLGLWFEGSAELADSKIEAWTGTPSSLMSSLSLTLTVVALLKDWSVHRLVKSLTTLARNPNSGVSFVDSSEREFRIVRKAFQK